MDCSVEEVAKLFFKHMVKYWGLPLNIVLDKYARFTSKFWTALFKLVGTKLFKSSAYHLQIDGQNKQINTLLEDYLRHYVWGKIVRLLCPSM